MPQGMGALNEKMGIELVEVSAERVVGDDAGRGQHPALRPAARRRVGGAGRDPRARSGSAMHAHPDRLSVGVDINATHHRAATGGHRHRRGDRRSTSAAAWRRYEVVITDEQRPAGLHLRGSPARCSRASGPG